MLLPSFLTLFAELVFIRRITKEIRMFSDFNSLVLLLCFLSPDALLLPIRKYGAERPCNQLRGLFAMRAHD